MPTALTPEYFIDFKASEIEGVAEGLGEALWLYTFERQVTQQMLAYLKDLYASFVEWLEDDEAVEGLTIELYLEVGAAYIKQNANDLYAPHFSFGKLQHTIPTGYNFDEVIRKAIAEHPDANLIPSYIDWLFGGTENSTEEYSAGLQEPAFSICKDHLKVDDLWVFFVDPLTPKIKLKDFKVPIQELLNNESVRSTFEGLGITYID